MVAKALTIWLDVKISPGTITVKPLVEGIDCLMLFPELPDGNSMVRLTEDTSLFVAKIQISSFALAGTVCTVVPPAESVPDTRSMLAPALKTCLEKVFDIFHPKTCVDSTKLSSPASEVPETVTEPFEPVEIETPLPAIR